MATVNEARDQLIAALNAWDFSEAFADNPAYGGVKGIMIVAGWPYATIDRMQSEATAGFMTMPIVSLVFAGGDEVNRVLGGAVGPGAGGTTRYGKRVEPEFLVSCWADENMGASQLVERLAGDVQGCFFYNQNRLASFRNLDCRLGREAFEDRPSLWRMDLTVKGRALITYDA